MLSFYSFGKISNPEEFAEEIRGIWKPFKVLGRIYVAHEGVNAQMAVPTNVVENFKMALETEVLFQGVRLNTDHTMTMKDFDKAKPFKALHIRVREQIVTDGFDSPLNWGASGSEMSPKMWHKELEDDDTIVLDCRNSYESDVGKFDR